MSDSDIEERARRSHGAAFTLNEGGPINDAAGGQMDYIEPYWTYNGNFGPLVAAAGFVPLLLAEIEHLRAGRAADPEAVNVARDLLEDEQDGNAARLVSRERLKILASSYLASAASRAAEEGGVTRPMIEYRQELREKREAELRAAVWAECRETCAKVVDECRHHGLTSPAEIAWAIRALEVPNE